MFKCGDKVLYGSHGICEILETEVRRIDKRNIEYFVLRPLNQSGARFYIPTGNEAALSKLQPILTAAQIENLIKQQKEQPDAWIADEGQRKQRYKELISGGDRGALIRMVHALHKHREQQQSAGRKFHLCDENFLRDAEKLLSAEFSLVLDIPEDKIGEYVTSTIESESKGL